MLRTLPIFLLVLLADCQSTDDLIAMVVQLYGPKQPVASNQARDTPQDTYSIIPISQTGTGVTEDVRCKIPNGPYGECVPYYRCRDYDVNTQNNGNRNIDLDPFQVCHSYLDICCQQSNIIRHDQSEKLPQRERVGCGWANPDGVDGIVGNNDDNTKFGEFPWIVAILNVRPANSNEPSGKKLLIYIGGGSLIHPSIVLTAAHYITSIKSQKIRAGEWDTHSTKEIYPFQDRDIASIEIHKDFDEKNLFYDIAVLFLDKPVDLAPNVGIVCLPPARIPQRETTRCIANGWGKDKFSKEGRYQVLLKKIEVPVIGHCDCQAALQKTRLGQHFKLHHTFMCAGGELGKDTCKGDGGAPLSCPIENEKDRYVQSGIVAWGIGCGTDGTPGVYVDVSVVRDWIDDKVVSKGYDPKIYSY